MKEYMRNKREKTETEISLLDPNIYKTSSVLDQIPQETNNVLNTVIPPKRKIIIKRKYNDNPYFITWKDNIKKLNYEFLNPKCIEILGFNVNWYDNYIRLLVNKEIKQKELVKLFNELPF